MDKLNNVINHPTTRYQTLQRLYSKYNKKLIPKLMDICNYKTNHHFLQGILLSSPLYKNIDTYSIDLSSIDSNHYLIRDLNTTQISRIRYKFYKVNDKNLINTKDDFYRLTNLSKILYSEKLFRIIRHNDAIEIFNELLTNPKYKKKPSSNSTNVEINNGLDVEDAVFAFSCFDQRHYELLIVSIWITFFLKIITN